MDKKFLSIAFVLAGVLVLTGAGCNIINRFSGNPPGNGGATSSAESASSTVAAGNPIDATILKFNLDRFRGKKWAGDIKQTLEGVAGKSTAAVMFPDQNVYVSMNFTLKIDELAIDFDNLSWADRAKKLGVLDNASSTAVSVVGRGQINYQNPWRMFYSAYAKSEITSNPLPIAFAGYIDFEHKILMFIKQFTNHPMLTTTMTSCPPPGYEKIMPCSVVSGGDELEAKEFWLQGMTFELGPGDKLILKEPVWFAKDPLETFTQMIQLTPGFVRGKKIESKATGILELIN